MTFYSKKLNLEKNNKEFRVKMKKTYSHCESVYRDILKDKIR